MGGAGGSRAGTGARGGQRHGLRKAQPQTKTPPNSTPHLCTLHQRQQPVLRQRQRLRRQLQLAHNLGHLPPHAAALQAEQNGGV